MDASLMCCSNPAPSGSASSLCSSESSVSLVSTRVAFEAFLFPDVTSLMVSVLLPVAVTVFFHQFDSVHPFCALPSVETGHERSCWKSLFRAERLPVQLERHQRVLFESVLDRHR